uniref:hypothetical protein n=1 Tax=Enterocloster clostridioformis TaxID=1531 RepID=UPI001C3D29E1|nr:hypothetical protein [Enterocloster clostridioformis]
MSTLIVYIQYEKYLFIEGSELKRINQLLHEEPESPCDCMGVDETIIYTVNFPNDMSVDVKICGVQFEEGNDNLPWTEAVLFKEGYEISSTEPAEEIKGEWILFDGEDEYIVNVKEKPEKTKTSAAWP